MLVSWLVCLLVGWLAGWVWVDMLCLRTCLLDLLDFSFHCLLWQLDIALTVCLICLIGCSCESFALLSKTALFSLDRGRFWQRCCIDCLICLVCSFAGLLYVAWYLCLICLLACLLRLTYLLCFARLICLVGWLVGWLDLLVDWLVSFFSSALLAWLVGRLVGWLVGLFGLLDLLTLLVFLLAFLGLSALRWLASLLSLLAQIAWPPTLLTWLFACLLALLCFDLLTLQS